MPLNILQTPLLISEIDYEFQHEPRLAVNSLRCQNYWPSIQNVEIGDGRLAVTPEDPELGHRQLQCAVLAAVGLTNQAAGSYLCISASTCKNYLQQAGRQLNIHKRAALGGLLLERGVFRQDRPATQSLQLTNRQHDVVTAAAAGMDNEDIAHYYDMACDTVKYHLRFVAGRTGWRSRAIIGLAGMVSGDIDPEEVGKLRREMAATDRYE